MLEGLEKLRYRRSRVEVLDPQRATRTPSADRREGEYQAVSSDGGEHQHMIMLVANQIPAETSC